MVWLKKNTVILLTDKNPVCIHILAIGDLFDMGVDVIHPIQKYTMDEREVAERFGGLVLYCGNQVDSWHKARI